MNRRYALIVKDLICHGCSANQDWLTNYEIITLKEPVYKKVDESCDDEKMMETLAKKCDRVSHRRDGLVEHGEYELKRHGDREYFLYVNELAARVLYWHTKDPEAVGIEDDWEAWDSVQLWNYPNPNFEGCGFVDLDGGDHGDGEEVPYMSDMISNAEEMLNTKGFISPYLAEYGMKVRILTDDMLESDSLKIVNENGEKEMFTKYYAHN